MHSITKNHRLLLKKKRTQRRTRTKTKIKLVKEEGNKKCDFVIDCDDSMRDLC